MLPLLLGLGLLAGNGLWASKRKEAREAELDKRYQGLLGVAPGAMGPEAPDGSMGAPTGGNGLLADPNSVGAQMQFAQGVMGLRGQRQYGLQLLNAAMQRAQQQEQQKRADSQWERQFGAQQQQWNQGQQNWQQQYDAQRGDAAEGTRRFGLQYGLQESEAQRAARQFDLTFGLQKRAQARLEADAGDKAAGGLPKLQAGYMWQMTPEGGAIAAPVPGTPDEVKGRLGLEGFRSIDTAIGNFLDLAAGKERQSNGGLLVRKDGAGTPMTGDDAQRLSSQRAAIISSVAQLRQMGVLDQKEYDRLDETLPDPTSVGSKFRRSRSIELAYQTLRDEVKAKIEAHVAAHPWLVPPIPQGFELEGGRRSPASSSKPGKRKPLPALPVGNAQGMFDRDTE